MLINFKLPKLPKSFLVLLSLDMYHDVEEVENELIKTPRFEHQLYTFGDFSS